MLRKKFKINYTPGHISQKDFFYFRIKEEIYQVRYKRS